MSLRNALRSLLLAPGDALVLTHATHLRSGLLLLLLALAGCSASEVVETPLGPVRITDDPDVPLYSASEVDGVRVEAFPEFGALVTTDPDGRPLGLEDRARAEAALAGYCGGVPPRQIGFRGIADQGDTWSSARCSRP